jgi:hypothetical protein
MLAVSESTSFPGASLFATVNVAPRLTTIYTRIGDALGWLCLAGALGMIVAVFIRARRIRNGKD